MNAFKQGMSQSSCNDKVKSEDPNLHLTSWRTDLCSIIEADWNSVHVCKILSHYMMSIQTETKLNDLMLLWKWAWQVAYFPKGGTFFFFFFPNLECMIIEVMQSWKEHNDYRHTYFIFDKNLRSWVWFYSIHTSLGTTFISVHSQKESRL